MSKKHNFQEVLATLSIIALLKYSYYQVFPFKLNVLSLWRDLRKLKQKFELSGFELAKWTNAVCTTVYINTKLLITLLANCIPGNYLDTHP